MIGLRTDDLADARATRTAGGLARYVAAATLARTADGGGVVAIVLLVTAAGGSGWEAGLLGASITAPHLLGPFVARRLDTAHDGRTVIAVACMVHGVTLGAAVLLFPWVWTGVTALLLVASGLVGPLLTGGISSRLPAIAGPDLVRQRRAQGWDVATYGLGGTIGPSIVAAVSVWSSPTAAALVLAAMTFAAAALVRILPASPPAGAGDVPRPLRTLAIMLGSGPLRRTLYLTVTVALAVAALPVTAVVVAPSLGAPAATAGVLTAVYGLGGLAASVGVMVRPSRADADPLMSRLALCVALALAGVALAASIGWMIAAYAVAGMLNSFFFAATLAARSEYSPLEARAQVFVWVGALKITAGSAGVAASGALIEGAIRMPVWLGVALVLAAVIVSTLDRRCARRASRVDRAQTLLGESARR